MDIKKMMEKLIAFVPPMAVYLIFAVLRPETFLSGGTLLMIFMQSIQSAIIAWGISFNMTAGVVDFSVGAEIALAGVAGVYLSRLMGVWGIVLGALACTMVVGLFKAIVMDAVKVNSMVISIAFTYIIASLSALAASKTTLVVSAKDTVLGELPFLVAIFIVMGGLMYLLNKYSTFGAKVRAIGGNETIAISSGIRPNRIRFMTVMIASFYMAVAAIIQVSRGAGAAATQGLSSMSSVFTSMMAYFLAMVLAGFVDSTIGIISGALCFTVLEVGLISVNMPANYKNCFVGVGLIVLLTAFGIRTARQKEKILRQQSEERHLKAEAAKA